MSHLHGFFDNNTSQSRVGLVTSPLQHMLLQHRSFTASKCPYLDGGDEEVKEERTERLHTLSKVREQRMPWLARKARTRQSSSIVHWITVVISTFRT